MTCLDIRRKLLTAPRERARDASGHIAACRDCGRLAARLDELDARLAEAFLVPVPDALAERVLLRRRPKPARRLAIAAAALLGVALSALAPQLWEEASGLSSPPVAAVGPTHPAVKAIELVVEQQPVLVDAPQGKDLVAMEQDLQRLGLKLDPDAARVDYAGKCYMPETECEHLVLDTAEGRVSVVLVPDYPVGERALVMDRRMTALMNPARSGGYIVVAASPQAAKRAAKLFSKS
jgi:hypothetical protein